VRKCYAKKEVENFDTNKHNLRCFSLQATIQYFSSFANFTPTSLSMLNSLGRATIAAILSVPRPQSHDEAAKIRFPCSKFIPPRLRSPRPTFEPITWYAARIASTELCSQIYRTNANFHTSETSVKLLHVTVTTGKSSTGVYALSIKTSLQPSIHPPLFYIPPTFYSHPFAFGTNGFPAS